MNFTVWSTAHQQNTNGNKNMEKHPFVVKSVCVDDHVCACLLGLPTTACILVTVNNSYFIKMAWDNAPKKKTCV